MLLVACYKQHGTIHDATLLKATVACYKVASCMVAFSLDHDQSRVMESCMAERRKPIYIVYKQS